MSAPESLEPLPEEDCDLGSELLLECVNCAAAGPNWVLLAASCACW